MCSFTTFLSHRSMKISRSRCWSAENRHRCANLDLVTWSRRLVGRCWGVRWSWGVGRSWSVGWCWSVRRRRRAGNGGHTGLASEQQVLGALNLRGRRWVAVGDWSRCVNWSWCWGVWGLWGVWWGGAVRWSGEDHVGAGAGGQEGEKGNGLHDEGDWFQANVTRKNAITRMIMFPQIDLVFISNGPYSLDGLRK